MLNLRIPEDVQNRVLEYYDEVTKAMYVKNTGVYSYLSTNMSDFVKLYQVRESIMNLSFINYSNKRQVESFVSKMQVSFYLPGDIIVKQGQKTTKFYYIHKGFVEVIQEKWDYVYFNYQDVEKFISQTADEDDERSNNEQSQQKSSKNTVSAKQCIP